MAKKGPLLERISEQVHDAWTEWTKQIQRRVKPVWRERWRELWVPYDELSEEEKDKDRKFARKIQTVVKSGGHSFAFELGRTLVKQAWTDPDNDGI
jgi:hypothetical protein